MSGNRSQNRSGNTPANRANPVFGAPAVTDSTNTQDADKPATDASPRGATPDEEAKPGPTIDVPASDAPVATIDNAAEIAKLQAELLEAQGDLAKAQADLAAARVQTSGMVEVELDTGAPRWVRDVSGMERKDIKGYTVLAGNVLVVVDKEGREGHRFTFLDRQRSE